jgi:uncharacterized protein YciI
MFIVSLNYIKPIEEVEAHLQAHVAYLEKYYKKEVFIASGRKVPRTGGVILAKAGSPEELQAVLREDPFHINGIAEYEVTEFAPTMTLPALSALKGM